MKDNKNYELEEKELFSYMLDSDLLPLPHGGEDEKYFVNK